MSRIDELVADGLCIEVSIWGVVIVRSSSR